MKVIAVIPAFNEARVIGRVINEVKSRVDEVVVVDDGSTDETFAVSESTGAVVLQHVINRGQGAALQTGIIFALKRQADIIVTFDADGQHQASEITRMTEPLLLGKVDVVLGSRFLDFSSNMPPSRRLVLQLATLFTKVYTGLKVTDTHNGFRAFSRLAAEKIEIKQDGMAHASEIIEQIKKRQLRFVEVAVKIVYSDYSLQKGQKLSNSFKILWDLIIGRLTK
ncbi:MAG: glycosyltransferase family 2 protein [Candidatus Buchananbacteria bacterium]|nr:glycosyltransferase family 2 protein [Candidatus Buchananbacteria bacterium]